ncbi:MAG: S8 family serine peptidase, partial [Dehalococcoidia bacterium]
MAGKSRGAGMGKTFTRSLNSISTNLILILLLVLTLLPSIVTVSPAEGRSSSSPRDATASINAPNSDLAPAELPTIGPKQEITLITGDVVTINSSEADGRYLFTLKPADPTKGLAFQSYNTPDGFYVIPQTADLTKLDKELFNIRYLLDEGYTNSSNLPIIVKVRKAVAAVPGANAVAAVILPLGANITMQNSDLGMVAAQLPDASIKSLYSNLVNQQQVEKIWLDKKEKLDLNDSVPLIGAPQVWASGYDGAGIKIAILDTGIDATHPDLDDMDDNPATNDPKVLLAINFTTDNSTQDLFGHGTHCASIAAGTGEASGHLYRGVAPGAHLYNVKVLNSQGWGYDSWIISGIVYAALGPDYVPHTGDEANVLSMSFGASWNSDGTDPMSQTVDWATDQGAVCVIAAGNAGPGMSSVATPAGARKAITVGASTKSDTIADFSSRGPTADLRLKPDVVAPGLDIVAARASGTSMGSPVNNYYTMASGTSMATPHVAGAAALILQAHPGWTPVMVKSSLIGRARMLTGVDLWAEGGGRIQVNESVQAKLLAEEPTLSFGRMQLGENKTATVTLHNPGSVPLTANIAAYTRCDNVTVNCVSVDPGLLSVPAQGENTFTVNVGPLDSTAPEGWYQGWLEITSEGKILRVPYLFSSFSSVTVRLYDTDNTTEIGGNWVLATYPEMEFVTRGGIGYISQINVKGGIYALLVSCGNISTPTGWVTDASRMFMIEKVITIPKLSDTTVRVSLAEAQVSKVSTKDIAGRSLLIHSYTQYFSGGPYYEGIIGKTMMRWSTESGQAGFEIVAPELTLYFSTYDPPGRLSEAFGYYATSGLLNNTYFPPEAYLINWKYHDVAALPSEIIYNQSELARYNFSYDMPETYPENRLNIENASWFTWDYMSDGQGGWVLERPVMAGTSATYYLTPDIATYWGYLAPTYGGWDIPDMGPLQDWNVGRFYPYPQIAPQKGETGDIKLGDFQFSPYLPGLALLMIPPGPGGTAVVLIGSIWNGLSWPHWQWGQLSDGTLLSPYPINRTPSYELSVDGNAVASGPLGRPDGTFNNGRWWDNILQSWIVSGSRGLLRVHMPSLATISDWSTYEVDFNLNSATVMVPFIRSLALPSNYSPGEKIALNVDPADGITITSVEYSFNKGATWLAAERMPGDYQLMAQAADQLDIRITGTDANGNIYKYTSPAAALSGQVKLSVAPQSVAGTPGQNIEIKGKLTTIEGTGLKGLAISMSDGNNLQYTSPDESGNFSFAYQINTV